MTASNLLTQIQNDLHPESTLQELDRAHMECQEMKSFTKAFLTEVTESRLLPINNKGNILF